MILPLKKYRITSRYGMRGVNFHNGIDLAAPVGTEIYSPADGVVSFVINNTLGGLQIGVKHNNGFTTGYAHLSETNRKVGDAVRQGEVIAKVGNTGTSTGAHLHFTVRQGGMVVNPENVFTF